MPATPSRPFSLALLGATGALGRAVLEVLEDLDVPATEVRLLATDRSAGQEIDLRGEPHRVAAVDAAGFAGADVAILAAGEAASLRWAPIARAAGCLVVDGSAAFRGDPAVPLVVPQVNPAALDAAGEGMVASPGALAVALALVLGPLDRAAGIASASVVALEEVSGAGRSGVEQLERELADLMNGREPPEPTGVPHRIAFNLVPQIGPVDADGAAEGEVRLAAELRRLLGRPGLPLAVTALRAPVFHGHAAAVHLALARPLEPEAARALLRSAPAVKVIDRPAERIYPMPMLAVNDDAVLVGRIRAVGEAPGGLALFLAIDDLRKGGAGNLVELALALLARRSAH